MSYDHSCGRNFPILATGAADRNVDAYRLLLRIEILVRELVREVFQAQYGASWRKQLPGPLLGKVRAAEKDEDLRRNLGFVRMGPLYYLTMGELLEILVPATSKPVLDQIGGRAFLTRLQGILPTRNAVGHSRAVSKSGLADLEATYQQLVTALGGERASRLLATPDVGLHSADAARSLVSWLERTLIVIERLECPCPESSNLDDCRIQHWWGVSEAAGFDCSLVDRAADLIVAYNAIPVGLGSRATRLRFVEDHSPKGCIGAAVTSLRGRLTEP
jgi:hypothetical protein